MKKIYWQILFLLILAVNLFAVYDNNETLRYSAKPLLILVLIAYFIAETGGGETALRKLIFSALFFSWIGDILLLFEEKGSLFFLLGLSAFLIAHIFYIIFFHGVRIREQVKSKWIFVLIVLVYYVALIYILSPYLDKMKLPVRVYGIVISFMFMLAMHMLFLKNKIAGILMMTGALFFVMSDSLLAFNKFYEPFQYAGILIMLTYGLAQWFITEGAIKYIRKK